MPDLNVKVPLLARQQKRKGVVGGRWQRLQQEHATVQSMCMVRYLMLEYVQKYAIDEHKPCFTS
jgi:hypothetical protein